MDKLIIIIITYFIGNISFAYVLGKIFMKKDIRDYGSGNAGTTNAIRVFGAKLGISAFIGDLFKGVFAIYIGSKINPDVGKYLAGISVIIGHNWPITMNFKGGKGVATSIGVMLMVNPLVSLICFGIGFPIAFITRTVSLGSIIGMILAPFVAFLFVKPFDKTFFAFTIALVIMAIYRHKSNIGRLIKGEEKKL